MRGAACTGRLGTIARLDPDRSVRAATEPPDRLASGTPPAFTMLAAAPASHQPERPAMLPGVAEVTGGGGGGETVPVSGAANNIWPAPRPCDAPGLLWKTLMSR